jgi:hypothetical protein
VEDQQLYSTGADVLEEANGALEKRNLTTLKFSLTFVGARKQELNHKEKFVLTTLPI